MLESTKQKGESGCAGSFLPAVGTALPRDGGAHAGRRGYKPSKRRSAFSHDLLDFCTTVKFEDLLRP
jgi:hypothetical protein